MDDKLRVSASNGVAVKLRSLIQEIPKDQLAEAVNKGNKFTGGTPLCWAAENGHAECVKLLLEANAEPNKGDNDGGTPLHRAAGNGRTECVKLLLEAKADPNKLNNDGNTPLHMAAGNDRAECVSLLLLFGADSTKVGNDKQNFFVRKQKQGLTPLVQSAFFGRSDEMRAQLAKGDDPNQGDADGPTPLHWASRWDRVECVKLLLEAKADPNKGDNENKTPLHKAAEGGSAESVKLLLEAKANSNQRDSFNQTPLHYAVEKGHAECVKLLLDDGTDRGEGLRTAARFGLTDHVRRFLAAGADVNAGDEEGRTAAYLAATHPISDKENPCLNVLINEGHAVFLSKHAALLTVQEKHIRAALFFIVGATLGGSFYAYFSQSNNLNTACDTFYGVLLQPYLFDFVTVFVFKVVQYVFEEALVPALSFVYFAAKWHCSGAERRAAADKGEAAGSSGDSEKDSAEIFNGDSNERLSFELSIQEDLESSVFTGGPEQAATEAAPTTPVVNAVQMVYEGTLEPAVDFAHFAAKWYCSEAGSRAATDNGKAAGPSRDSENDPADSVDGDLNEHLSSKLSIQEDLESRVVTGSPEHAAPPIAPSSSPAAAAPSPAISISIPLSSRLLYALFGEEAVKAWRKDKYKKAEKTDQGYKGDDFWLQTPYLFFDLQVASAFASFVVAAVNVDRSLPAWDQYTNFYMLCVNSGITTAMFSWFKMGLLDGRYPQMEGVEGFPGNRYMHFIIRFPALLLLPPLFTHVIPMMFVYCWIAVPVAFFLFFGVVDLWREFALPFLVSKGVRGPFAQYFALLLWEVCMRFAFIFAFHTLFNWGSLLYMQGLPITPEGYIGVLVRDWQLRSQTQCFLSSATNSAHGVVVLFSWF